MTPRNDCVICPNCCHQFPAICVDDQKYRAQLERDLRAAREALAETYEWLIDSGRALELPSHLKGMMKDALKERIDAIRAAREERDE